MVIGSITTYQIVTGSIYNMVNRLVNQFPIYYLDNGLLNTMLEGIQIHKQHVIWPLVPLTTCQKITGSIGNRLDGKWIYQHVRQTQLLSTTCQIDTGAINKPTLEPLPNCQNVIRLTTCQIISDSINILTDTRSINHL